MNRLPPWLSVGQTMGICTFILGLLNYVTGKFVIPDNGQVALAIATIALWRIERGGGHG